jgi:hypothetical protein
VLLVVVNYSQSISVEAFNTDQRVPGVSLHAAESDTDLKWATTAGPNKQRKVSKHEFF